jgi:hypothetical protein
MILLSRSSLGRAPHEPTSLYAVPTFASNRALTATSPKPQGFWTFPIND